MTKSTTVNFETKLEQLDQIIEQVESGQLSLEQSLEQFEQGMKLIKSCQQALKKVEQKVSILLQQHDQATLEPYQDTE